MRLIFTGCSTITPTSVRFSTRRSVGRQAGADNSHLRNASNSPTIQYFCGIFPHKLHPNRQKRFRPVATFCMLSRISCFRPCLIQKTSDHTDKAAIRAGQPQHSTTLVSFTLIFTTTSIKHSTKSIKSPYDGRWNIPLLRCHSSINAFL